VADEHGGWRTYGEKTIYDNQWVRLGLVDVEAPNPTWLKLVSPSGLVDLRERGIEVGG
jgi:hypothetical protein